MLVWCYSDCISTPGRLEKYAWPRWESNLRPFPNVLGSIQARSWLSISGGALQKECNRGRAAKFRWLKTWRLLGPLVHSFRIVPDHFRKFFFRNKLILATSPPPPPPPPPRRQKIFDQCTILGVKKNFPELLIANIFVIIFVFVICIVKMEIKRLLQ
jgi:hypothetical protein